MSEMAKKARAALKGKARKLASEKSGKVDSSDWTPAEPLNADVQTGMRPVSRRAYKKGGKVEGEACAPTHMGRKARKSGGKVESEKSEAAEIAKAKINRNVKAANEEREGVKHVGGMKKGGRAKREDGGATKFGMTTPREDKPAPRNHSKDKVSYHKETGEPIYTRADTGEKYKKGGRAKKMDGGTLDKMVDPATRGRIEAGSKTPTEMPKNPPMPPRRPAEPVGGKGTEPVGLDKDQVERLSRGRKDGGRAERMLGGNAPDPRMDIVKKKAMDFGSGAQGTPYKKGGRIERKAGGRAKGKTNINIVIAAGKPATPDMTQQGGPPMPPPGVPVPLPGGPGGAPGGMPMGGPAGGMPPMPMPPAPPQMPGGPMARKDGGRITKVAKSYKDMEAGSGGAEGRLQKTDIAKTGKGAPTFKRGGKVYRSYKDMDAGSGSGLGRMEKTEIQSHKQ